MRVLLISTYELGHQPLHVASPAAALRRAGHEVRCLDLSVQPWDPDALDWARAVGFSVPMHTAMRLALNAARRLRGEYPRLPICFYGLYAPVSRELVVGELAGRAIAGEYEPALLAWASGLASPGALTRGLRAAHHPPSTRELRPAGARAAASARALRPPGGAAARSAWSATWRPAMAACTAAGTARFPRSTTGAYGSCRRTRFCVTSSVWSSMGARHITFGDPDFLNGRRHSIAIVRALHERFPTLTFDCTTKVEHVLEHADVWEELAASGCLFVVSALECVNDEILARLDKGHTTEEAVLAIELLREQGIETRPSFMPFTPWSTPADVLDILDFVVAHDLVANVDRGSVHDPAVGARGFSAARAGGPAGAPRGLRRRTPELPMAVGRPGRRPAPGPPERTGRAEHGRAGTDRAGLLPRPRGGARRGRETRDGDERMRSDHDGLDRGTASAHRALVLLCRAN